MLVKINAKDKDALSKVCHLTEYNCQFFTMERNPLMVQAEILNSNGTDVTNREAFYIGKMMICEMDVRDLKALNR